MKTKRTTRRLVRHWVPRFRGAETHVIKVYERHAHAVYYLSEAKVVERVCRSELRRRNKGL